MTATTTPRRPHLVRRDAAPVRRAVAAYSKPLPDDVCAAVVARGGQAMLDDLLVQAAAYLAEQQALLAALTAEEAEAEAYWNCTRCQGTGDYQAPTSRTQRGRPVCFDCGGTGRR